MLKIHPYEKYIGSAPAYSYIAIRADKNRQGYTGGGKPVLLSEEPNIVPVYPFKDDGVGLADVQRLLDDSGLGLPRYYEWRSRSGCYFCFYQQIAEWQGLKERHPALFERAKAYETRSGRDYTWVDGRSLDDVEKTAVSPDPQGEVGRSRLRHLPSVRRPMSTKALIDFLATYGPTAAGQSMYDEHVLEGAERFRVRPISVDTGKVDRIVDALTAANPDRSS